MPTSLLRQLAHCRVLAALLHCWLRWRTGAAAQKSTARSGCPSWCSRAARQAPSGYHSRSSQAVPAARRGGTPSGCCCATTANARGPSDRHPTRAYSSSASCAAPRLGQGAPGKAEGRGNPGLGEGAETGGQRNTFGDMSAGKSLCSSTLVMRCPASPLPCEVSTDAGTSSDVLEAGLRGDAPGLSPWSLRSRDSIQRRTEC